MQEFIDFIEEVVDVDDQTDPEKENIIHAFYRNHNTLQKTNENFRLLEYKRKQYIAAKKSNSKSPPKTARACVNDESLSPPQKEFITSLYGDEKKKSIIIKQKGVQSKTLYNSRFMKLATNSAS